MDEKIITVQCASCKETVDYCECYKMYVGMGSYQFICKGCQKQPFITVMENSLWAESYVGFPPKTLDQLLAEKNGKE